MNNSPSTEHDEHEYGECAECDARDTRWLTRVVAFIVALNAAGLALFMYLAYQDAQHPTYGSSTTGDNPTAASRAQAEWVVDAWNMAAAQTVTSEDLVLNPDLVATAGRIVNMETHVSPSSPWVAFASDAWLCAGRATGEYLERVLCWQREGYVSEWHKDYISDADAQTWLTD